VEALHDGWLAGLLPTREDQLGANVAEERTLGRTKQAKIAHFDKAFWQHVLEKLLEKRWRREGFGTSLVRLPVGVTKGHLIVLHAQEPIVTQCHPEDVRRQVFQGGFTGANWATIDDPWALPNRWVNDSSTWKLAERGVQFPPEQQG
jgi:hypothetical protein